MSVVAHFDVHRVQYLDAGSHLVADAPALARDRAHLSALYRAMVRTRIFDAKAVSLQRTGRLGTYAACLGQEAIGVCIADRMQTDDVLLPSYRETAAYLGRGVRMEELLLYWGGDERGMDFADDREDFPICVPIATQLTQATGVAAAFAYRSEARVAVAVCGDGATSQGDFYAALNLAGAWTLPFICVVNNNQWAISVARKAQSAAQTLAQKAIAAGIHGVQVDGNDPIALCSVLDVALDRARRGGGATLIEALSYRLCDHTTADDAARYRPLEEVEAARQSEPVVRLRRYLHAQGWWNADDEEALKNACSAEVDGAVERYLATPAPEPTAMFDHLYASLPAPLQAPRAALAARGSDA